VKGHRSCICPIYYLEWLQTCDNGQLKGSDLSVKLNMLVISGIVQALQSLEADEATAKVIGVCVCVCVCVCVHSISHFISLLLFITFYVFSHYVRRHINWSDNIFLF